MKHLDNRLSMSDVKPRDGSDDDDDQSALDGQYLVDREDEQNAPGAGAKERANNAWLASQDYPSDVEELNFD